MFSTRSYLRKFHLRIKSNGQALSHQKVTFINAMTPRSKTRSVYLLIAAALLLCLHLLRYSFPLHSLPLSLPWRASQPQIILPMELIDYDRSTIKRISSQTIDFLYSHTDKTNVKWSRLAYVTYATSETHLCNAVMLLSDLRSKGTKASLVILLTEDVDISPTIDGSVKRANVIVNRVKRIQQLNRDSYWTSSMTKMNIFGLIDYERIIYMDSDSQIPQGHLDELFFIPPVEIAVVPAYWLIAPLFDMSWWSSLMASKNDGNWEPPRPMTHSEKIQYENEFVMNLTRYADSTGKLPVWPFSKVELTSEQLVTQKNMYTTVYNSLPAHFNIRQFYITSILMVITPSFPLYERAMETLSVSSPTDFDMELINQMFSLPAILKRQRARKKTLTAIPDLLILPHQRYGLLTSELNVKRKHSTFLAELEDIPYIDRSEWRITHSSEAAYYDYTSFEHESSEWLPNVKYLHFSDSPIPKPWIEKDVHAEYMGHRRRCTPFKESKSKDLKLVKPQYETRDCKAAQAWDQFHAKFSQQRWDVCGLKLIKLDDDGYASDIH
ncbi:CYFA0S37e00628g1_1 [Cyberlindnera fabianii]|uniref:CYFA0S37e00628g1_1 n=1 Tax=Cyberlindnera fabianii TaxID=36022 RepID=A0A061BEI9_CYBFA|nr:CYFA0S37e00628g1_1 [Cyberlindnera fabianii]